MTKNPILINHIFVKILVSILTIQSGMTKIGTRMEDDKDPVDPADPV